MKALAFFGITRAINATTGPVFQGIGKPKINTVGSIFQLVVFIAIIYPLTHRWGILGTSIAVIIPNILFMIYIVKKLESTMNYKLVNFIAFLLPPIIGSITMCFVLSLVYIWDNITLFGFLLSIILAISIYLIVMYNIDKFSNYGLKNNLSQLFLRMWGHGKE
jgi:O-antigen/teichoic acid export membrane protein